MNIARASFKLFSAQILVILLGAIGLIVFARQLTPAQLGVFFLFQALFSVFLDIGGLGIWTAVEKRISEGQRATDVLATAVALQSAVLVVITLGILLFRDRINSFIGADFVLYLAAAVAAGVFARLLLAVLRGELRVEATAPLTLLNHVIWIGLGLALLAVGFGIEALVYAFLMGHIATLLGAIYRITTPIGRPTREYTYSLLSYVRHSFFTAMSWQAYNWMDVLIIGWLLSYAAVGAYEVAWQLSGVVTILSVAIAMTIFSQVSAWHSQAATDRIERLFQNALTPSLFLIIPAVFGVAILSRPILSIVFGQEYAVAWFVLIILTVGKISEGIYVINSKCVEGLGRPDLVARATIIGGVLNVILNVTLVMRLGFVGAAIATVVAYTIQTAMVFRYLSAMITVRVPYQDIGWCIGAAAVMGIVVFQIRTMIGVETALELIAAITVGALVYGILVLASQRLREQAVLVSRIILSKSVE